MHCSNCKTVIEKGVMVVDREVQEGDYITNIYCKRCFKKDFINDTTTTR